MNCSWIASPIGALALVATASLASGQEAQKRFPFKFVDTGTSKGLQAFTNNVHGGGVSASDMDNDGDIDLFLAQSEGNPLQLFKWDAPAGIYQERSGALGLTSTEGGRVALWIDYDADRDLDIWVCNESSAVTSFRLYEQITPGSFSDVTAAAGLLINEGGFNRAGMAAGDLNGDGFLDVYCGMWDNGGTAVASLFLNNGDKTFTDISVSSGIRSGIANTQWQSIMHDFDQDGLMDIYTNVDFQDNYLWINQGNNTFANVAPSCNADNSMNDMGLYPMDFDEDGDIDLYITNIKNMNENNVLLRNDSAGGTLQFTDISLAEGVDDGSWGWGCTYVDADNDGHADLVATNGFANPPWDDDTTRFFYNKGSGPDWFGPNRSKQAGTDDPYWGVSIIGFDYDRDFDIDLFQTTNIAGFERLLENQQVVDTPRRHAIVVQPRMRGNNYYGIGSIVRVTTSFNTQTRLITAGCSYQAQEPAEAFFGTNLDTQVDVTVEFPDGTTSTVTGVPVDTILKVAPPPVTDAVAVLGTVTAGDVANLVGADNRRMRINAIGGGTLQVGLHTSVASPTTLDLGIEADTNIASVSAEAFLHNWNTDQWDSLGTWPLLLTDTIQNFNGIAATDYVNADGRVELQIRSTRTPVAFKVQHALQVDNISLTVN